MKIKILLLLFSICGYSQQTLKRITETDSEFIIELFILRNGSSNCDISGTDTFNSASGGCYFSYKTIANNVVTYYDHSPTSIYETNVALPSLQLGTEMYNFSPVTSWHVKSLDEGSTVYLGENMMNYTPLLDITTEGYSGGSKIAGISFPNLFYGKLILKKTLDDGSAIPTNLWVDFKTYDAYYNNPPIHVGEMWYGKFDGSTWVEQSTDILGNAVTSIPSICSLLSTAEIVAIDAAVFIAPNPVGGVLAVHTIGNTNDNFQYEIIDYSGRVVLKGTSDFSETINTSSLIQGNYVLQIERQSEVSHLKFIKK